MTIEKIRYLPRDVSPPGFSDERVRGRNGVDWLEDIVMIFLKIFRPMLLEECSRLPLEGAGEMKRSKLLKSLPKGSATLKRMFFLWSLGLCAMLTTVENVVVLCACQK